ncbi:MAG TPA: hypothetical protein VHU40_04815, partial [Polyangia bacterium]|nr:hypothetical protein [Polyangia bacterium]
FKWGPRALGGKGANRRSDRGPRLIIEVGPPPERSFPAPEAPVPPAPETPASPGEQTDAR